MLLVSYTCECLHFAGGEHGADVGVLQAQHGDCAKVAVCPGQSKCQGQGLCVEFAFFEKAYAFFAPFISFLPFFFFLLFPKLHHSPWQHVSIFFF